jgi:hypothetical protein
MKRVSPKHTRKSMPTKQLLQRRYRCDVRHLKEKCTKLRIALMSYEQAGPSDICVLSSSEIEIGATRQECLLENENYFVNEEDVDLVL